MQAYEFINNMIPPLKYSDKVKMALSWMEEIRTDVLPVVDEGIFRGLVTDEMIYNINREDILISEVPLEAEGCFVLKEKHIYDVLRVASEYQTNMVAVVDSDNIYHGVVTLEDAIAAFADSLSIQAQGGVLVLSMFMTDYSLFEIARVIESENAKILSSFLTSDPLDESKIKVVLKIDKTELRHVKATLERFGYKVIDHYQEEMGVSGEQDRLDNLLRFLNI
ncbi:CBS domain-containing protein [Echinicola sp. CAU 1574]|uniref:CBS domain-containing protein n=1 Tax=Echinicola arenosa TaxID=2774144 RepID=A0ABR9AJ79_9BACT|nr:CBS domain-containing protein [Echinicola arenosa]MBD8488361.1 CBS domain-containing protein [Echinicola arenosa]